MPHARLVSLPYVRSLLAERRGLRTEVARLQVLVASYDLAVRQRDAALAKLAALLEAGGHAWGRETDSGLYRCGQCGLRTRTPDAVLVVCGELRPETRGRKRPA